METLRNRLAKNEEAVKNLTEIVYSLREQVENLSSLIYHVRPPTQFPEQNLTETKGTIRNHSETVVEVKFKYWS